MNFQDIGIIIVKKTLKENSNIISIISASHGIYSGVIRNNEKNANATYQLSNFVEFSWKARLEEHIGIVKAELLKSYSGILMYDRMKLYAFNSLASTISLVFYEREPHNDFFIIFKDYLDKLAIEFKFIDYIKVELEILSNAGYRLSLDKCAVNNSNDDLFYVSPKSGRAISYNEGKKYEDRLLILPSLLNPNKIIYDEYDKQEQKYAIDLVSYFFNRYLFKNKIQHSRNLFINTLFDNISLINN